VVTARHTCDPPEALQTGTGKS